MKDARTKSRKIDPLVRINSTLPCPCGHTINFEKSEVFCTKKPSAFEELPPLVRKMSALDKPLPPDCGPLSWMAPYNMTINYPGSFDWLTL